MSENVIDRMRAAAGDLWGRATVHPSFGDDYYQRLRFLGGGAMDLALADLLYHRFWGKREQLTRIFDILRCEDTLCEAGRAIGLDAAVRFVPPRDGRLEDEMVAGTMEAVIGAVLERSGYEIAKGLMEEAVFTDERLERAQNDPDPIAIVREAFDGSPLQPRVVAYEEVIDGERVFFHGLEIEGVGFMGRGPSKRKAQAQASQMLLDRIIDPFSS